MTEKGWRVTCIGLGIAGLLLSRHYSGPGADYFHSYGANLTFSFASYFLLRLLDLPPKGNRYAAAAYSLLGVSLQEIAQALGFYPGVFDPLDFLFNAAGVSLALGLATTRQRISKKGALQTEALRSDR